MGATVIQFMPETQVSEEERGKGVKFDRVRRITGYLVGGMNRWNSAKKAEEHDRVKHDASMTSVNNAVSA